MIEILAGQLVQFGVYSAAILMTQVRPGSPIGQIMLYNNKVESRHNKCKSIRRVHGMERGIQNGTTLK